MKWEDLTTDKLYQFLKKRTSLPLVYKNDTIHIEVSKPKKIEITLSVSKIDEALKRNCKWKSTTLLHIQLQQNKGILRGEGTAVDNTEDFRKELTVCIGRGKEWREGL